MNRRKLLYFCALIILLIAMSIGTGVIDPSTRFSEYQFHQIRIGMTEKEVGAILGPAGDYRSFRPPGGITSVGNVAIGISRRGITDEEGWNNSKKWICDRYMIRIVFNEDGKVVAVSISEFV